MRCEIDDSKAKPVQLEKVLSKGEYTLLFASSARAHELVRTRKISRDAKGKPGGSSVDQHGAHVYPHWSNLLLRLNDWVSENSSLFDGSSTRSTASTKDSTSEELWEHMSAESDSVSSNSSSIISENSDGFACSPPGSRHWHVKADVPTPMIGPGSNASSSGREIDGTVAKRNSFLYSDNART